MTRRALAPLVAAALGLLGCLAITLFLHRAATSAVERAVDERLRGAGQSAAQLLSDCPVTSERLRQLMEANALDGAFVVNRSLRLVADATGPAGGRVDLLRVDPERLQGALGGQVTVDAGYRLGELTVATGYFPLRQNGEVSAVLALEAGEAFTGAGENLPRALGLGVGLSLLSAVALAVTAARWARAEKRHREQEARVARGEVLARMAAVAAHEIRNPLGVIRAIVELMRMRSAASLSTRDQSDLGDVLSEVDRLKQLTQDFLELSAERELALGQVNLELVLADACNATEVTFPSVRVKRPEEVALPAVQGDPGRLRQVLANLLTNAAQAQREGEISVDAGVEAGQVRIVVRDQGPGVAADLRDKLFEPFVTGKSGGTGLGLAVSRQIIQRHGGTLSLLPTDKGAAFEIRLPQAPADPEGEVHPPAPGA
jgi:signal transduction histidine kinase